jgi:hypothetical protein
VSRSGLLAALLLTGCSASPVAEHPVPRASAAPSTPTPTPTPAPTVVVPEVPTTGTELAPVVAVVAPVRVQVADAGIDVAVEPVGVLDSGEMELPANTQVAGWYEYGPVPSSPAGATILAAHVDSLKYGLGPFSRLKQLSPGAAVTVTTADGATHAYVISEITRVAKKEIPLDDIFDRTGAPQLVMITCGGQFDYETGHYLDNILATATPVLP